jgi:hypothetical protein
VSRRGLDGDLDAEGPRAGRRTDSFGILQAVTTVTTCCASSTTPTSLSFTCSRLEKYITTRASFDNLIRRSPGR